MPQLNTAEAVAASLVANGIDTLYCVPGVQNDVLMDALFYHVQDKIRIVHTRHEQGAAFMALGAAMATGKPQVYAVVPGPGFLNSTAALATAHACNAPVLALVGQIPQQHIGRGFGFLHEIPDQLGVMRSLTKWAARIDTPQDAPAPRRRGVPVRCSTGRPRPVGLECAVDVWPRSRGGALDGKRSVTVAQRRSTKTRSKPPRRCLARPKQPLMVVGGGAQHASAEVKALAEWLQIAGRCRPDGFGVGLPPSAQHHLPVAHKLWSQADVVLAVGTRLQLQTDGLGPRCRSQDHPHRHRRGGDRPHLPSPRLASSATRHGARRSVRRDPRQKSGAPLAARRARPRPRFIRDRSQRAAAATRLSPGDPRRLPENGILVDEVTQLGHAARFGYPVYRPRTFITPGYQGTLGWGYATALGVKVARPDCPW